MRKKETRERYIIYDRKKQEIASYLEEEFPLKKPVIVEKSIQFFDDPTPCYLHENAVKVRMLEEIRRILKGKEEPTAIRMLPAEVQRYFEAGEEAYFIAII